MAIEPLAGQARTGRRYRGLDVHGGIQYIALYADGLLMFLVDTGAALVGARRLLQDLELVAGLKVNWEKSCLFPAAPVREGPPSSSGVHWEYNCLTYLGTHIYHKQADLVEGNVPELSEGFRAAWSSGERSRSLWRTEWPCLRWWPYRGYYYFRTLPIWLPATIFKRLQMMITVFFG